MADLTLDASDSVDITDTSDPFGDLRLTFAVGLQVLDDFGTIDSKAAALSLGLSDEMLFIDISVQVIPSYLDRLYIDEVEHFITILSVE